MFFNRKKTEKKEWLDTDEGKEFVEKVTKEKIERDRKNEEMNKALTPEKKKELFWMRFVLCIIWPLYFIGSVIAVKKEFLLIFLASITVISGLLLLIYFFTPKFIKYRRPFIVPSICCAATLVYYVLAWIIGIITAFLWSLYK